jgi:predicted ATPase/class 3 adenylate cyclase
MSQRSDTFGRLLKGAINSIAAYEAKTAPAVEEELGAKLGVAGSAIQRYKSGFLPPDTRAVQLFAEAAVRRAYLGRAWLARFLQSAHYPTAEALIDQLTGPAPSHSAALPARTTTPPTGIVVFLFTDIKGSTTLWEQHPQAMQRALARHDALLTEAITAQGGVVFKTIGDAFCAVFTTVSDALLSALVAQRTLQAEPWGETGPIDVRMAIHAGAAEARAGDYFGSPLNRVARLCGVAAGRQILVSQAAEALARDQLPSDVQLQDLGTHRLKDLTRPEPIYQLIAVDLPSVFPPLKSLSSYRTNLPAQPTIVIGRDVEVATVRDALCRADVRLMTLSGPGGIGKTRLALEVAAALLDDFPDGVWFVSLAPIADSSLVVATIAQALGLQEVSGHSLIDRLKRYLREKALLLVLDNFEQVVGAAPLIADLLTVAPTLKVLITSRSRLRLSGEREFVVPPLTLPDRKPLPPLERLTQYEAVQLFIERAQAAKTDFVVTSANAPAIADICARLDGLPLAIELAAARIKLFAPAALLARLTHRLTLLIDGPQDLPARQQTLRAAISWSYDLLDASQQILFARLAVFAGGCAIEAAETICDLTGDPESTTVQVPIFDGLSALLDQSLLRQMEDPHGEPRFMMLETMREYALERLGARGEIDALRQRHAVYFASLADVADVQLDGAEQATGLQQLDAEIDNLRAALTWLYASDTLLDLGLQLAGSLSSYWLWRGLYSEGRMWLSRMLGRATLATPARGRALREAGMLAWFQGDFATAAALLEESLALCRQLDDLVGIAWAQRSLAVAVADHDDVERAKALFGESLALFRKLGHVRGTAWALAGWGSVSTRHNDLVHARTLLSEGLTLFRELNDRQGIACTLSFLGYIATRDNDLDRAAALLTESLTVSQELGYLSNNAWALASLGHVARRQHDSARARELIAESLAIFRELDERRGIAITSATLGQLEHEHGAYERAAALLTESVAICRELGERHVIPGLLRNLGAAECARGDHGQATAALAESLTFARSLNDQSGIAASLEQIAEVLVQTGASERAAHLFGAAEVLHDVSGQPREPEPDQTYAQAITTLRSQLSATTFAAAWTTGRALTLEQAMTEALEQDGGSRD